jgi:hypothetical protein
MCAALFKRPRGRPPTKPAHLRDYRARTLRMRNDGTPCKVPTHITSDQLEAWLEAHTGEFWTGRGRPPAGQRAWAKAAAEHFAISRRTVLRLVDAINRRRARVARSLSLDAASAGMLAALTERYRRTAIATTSRSPTSATPAAAARMNSPPYATASSADSGPGILIEPLTHKRLQDGIVHYVSELADDAFLRQLADLVARHHAIARTSTPAPGRSLDAIGLRTAPARPAPLSAPPVSAAAETIRSALMDALDAVASLGGDPRLMAAVRQLQLLLDAP